MKNNMNFDEKQTQAANDVETIEKVLDDNTMLGNLDNKKNLINGLVNFHKKIGAIIKDQQGYGYKYAGLDTVFKSIREPLIESGLAVTQLVSGKNDLTITTILSHISGESITNNFTLSFDKLPSSKNLNFIQNLGASITYLKRYCLTSMLAISAEDDQDGVVKEKMVSKTKKFTNYEKKQNFTPSAEKVPFSDSKKKNDAIEKLNSCTTLSQLKAVFESIESDNKTPVLIAHKDKLKVKLQMKENYVSISTNASQPVKPPKVKTQFSKPVKPPTYAGYN